MQERGYDLGFHEIWGHSPSMPPQTEEFLLKHLILQGFGWISPEIRWIS